MYDSPRRWGAVRNGAVQQYVCEDPLRSIGDNPLANTALSERIISTKLVTGTLIAARGAPCTHFNVRYTFSTSILYFFTLRFSC